MTQISWLGAYHCQSLLNNENRKLVSLQSLCYRGITRHNKTEALQCVGKRRIFRKFRNGLSPSHTQALDCAGCGNWQWPLGNHLLPWDCRERSQLSLYAPAYVSCSRVWALRRAWLEERESQRCPWSISSCESNVQGSVREKGSRAQQRMCLSWGRYWEQVAGRRRKSGLMGNIHYNFSVTVLGNLHQFFCRQTSCQAWRSSQESQRCLPPPRAASQLSMFNASWKLYPLCSEWLRLKLLFVSMVFTEVLQGWWGRSECGRWHFWSLCSALDWWGFGLFGHWAVSFQIYLKLLWVEGRGYCGCEQVHLYLLWYVSSVLHIITSFYKILCIKPHY